MAHVLKVTDGTTTITLTSGDMYLAEYEPAVAVDVFSPVKERAKVGFTSSVATIQSNVRALNRLLFQAQSYARNKTGSRVYVTFDPGTSGTEWRSLLYGGAVHPGADFLGYEWAGNAVELDIEWTRDPYWEGALTQLPLSNGAATDSTDWVTLDNSNDATHYNYLSFDSTDIVGDLPAPVKLDLRNPSSDLSFGKDIYVFHNVYSNPSGFKHIIEAETSTDSHVTSTTDSTCSNGAYAAIAWDSTGATRIAEWTIASTDLGDAAGGRFAIMARWKGNFTYTNCWLQLRLETSPAEADIWVGNLSLVSATTDGSELTLLDTVRLPPYLEGLTTMRGIMLTLYGTRDSTDNDLLLDYLQLSPISGDSGWMRFRCVASGIPAGQEFIYDGTEGMTYWEDGSSRKTGYYTTYGGPILLVPNVTQRLYILTANASEIALPSRKWEAKVWYRPRRFLV